MLSRRAITCVAILLMAIPSAVVAAPIVQPPRPERIVEGHTVFTVITQYGQVGPLPVPDLDLNLTLDLDLSLDVLLDLELFSDLTVDLCIKNTQINGTIEEEEQANATGGAGGRLDHEGNASVDDVPGGSGGSQPIGPVGPTGAGTGPVEPPMPTFPPRDEVCVAPKRPNTTSVTEQFAAAVAILVREYNPNQQDKLFINATANVQATVAANAGIDLDINETVTSTSDVCTDFGIFPCVRRGNNGAWSRFPGVLWFNDQYLVGPNSRVGSDDREGEPFDAGFGAAGPNGSFGPGPVGLGPFGTAPFAAGLCADVPYSQVPPVPEVPCDPHGRAPYRYPCGGAIMAVRQGMPDPREVMLRVEGSGTALDGSHPGTSGGTSDDFAWVGVDLTGGPSGEPNVTTTSVPSKTEGVGPATVPAIDYQESYLITDPNDHSWTIDLYRARTQKWQTLGVAPTSGSSQQTFFIWVVNTLGSAHFVPDDGHLNCIPFEDWMPQPVRATFEAQDCERLPNNREAPPNLDNAHLTPRDDPCSGYEEPSDGPVAYCYGGQPATDVDGDGDVDRADCVASRPTSTPLRLYNGLLYFRSQQLGAMDGQLTHGSTSAHTNGCQPGSEWVCPGGDDDAEGDSHPFHPDVHTGNADAGTCPKGNAPPDQMTGFQSNANGGNHGGSATPTDPDEPWNNECDFTHAVWNIDIYFSPSGRPFPPRERNFAVQDTQGSDAAFASTEDPGHP